MLAASQLYVLPVFALGARLEPFLSTINGSLGYHNSQKLSHNKTIQGRKRHPGGVLIPTLKTKIKVTNFYTSYKTRDQNKSIEMK
jgi:hypothetical protein